MDLTIREQNCVIPSIRLLFGAFAYRQHPFRIFHFNHYLTSSGPEKRRTHCANVKEGRFFFIVDEIAHNLSNRLLWNSESDLHLVRKILAINRSMQLHPRNFSVMGEIIGIWTSLYKNWEDERGEMRSGVRRWILRMPGQDIALEAYPHGEVMPD